jgi:hypothetical protein
MKTMMKRVMDLVLAAGLVMSASATMAAAPLALFPTTAGHATGLPGSQVTPTLTFDFAGGYDLTGILLSFTYESSMLSFNAGASTVSISVPFGPTTVQSVVTYQDLVDEMSNADSAFFIDVNDAPGSFSLAVAYPPALSYPMPAGTQFVVNGVFTIAPSATLGVPLPIEITGQLGNQAGFDDFANTVNVTAVPEPETWLMLLGGLGLLATRIRRKATLRPEAARGS